MTDFLSADTYLLQAGLKSLGFDPGPLDGDEGPLTRGAKQRWLFSLVNGVTGTGRKMVKLALSQVGIRETSRNHGAGIAKYWDATSYKDGYRNREPYCAAFVCWVVREVVGKADRDFSLPTSAVAHKMMDWAKANKGKGVAIVTKDRAQPGDILVFHIRHIAILEKVEGNMFHTIEGNTDGSGSREGDGVYRRARNPKVIQMVVRLT